MTARFCQSCSTTEKGKEGIFSPDYTDLTTECLCQVYDIKDELYYFLGLPDHVSNRIK
jgi:hypothetical protein